MAHWWSAPANKAGRFPLENAVLPVIWFSRASSLVKRSSGEALGWPVVCVSVGDGEAALAGWGHEGHLSCRGDYFTPSPMVRCPAPGDYAWPCSFLPEGTTDVQGSPGLLRCARATGQVRPPPQWRATASVPPQPPRLATEQEPGLPPR